jgi:hypothetical protein
VEPALVPQSSGMATHAWPGRQRSSKSRHKDVVGWNLGQGLCQRRRKSQ